MTAIKIRTLHTTPPAIVPALRVGLVVGGAEVGDGAGVTVEAVTVEAVEEKHTRNNIFVLGQSQ